MIRRNICFVHYHYPIDFPQCRASNSLLVDPFGLRAHVETMLCSKLSPFVLWHINLYKSLMRLCSRRQAAVTQGSVNLHYLLLLAYLLMQISTLGFADQ